MNEVLKTIGLAIVGVLIVLLSIWFWCYLGYNVIYSEVHEAELIIMDKKEDVQGIWNGYSLVYLTDYYIIVEYKNTNYKIEVERSFYDSVERGDYITCLVEIRTKENGKETTRVSLKMSAGRKVIYNV